MKFLLTNFKVQAKIYSPESPLYKKRKKGTLVAFLSQKKAKKQDNELVMTDQNSPQKNIIFLVLLVIG